MIKTTLHHRFPCKRSQAGAALAISLIMLLLLTIIGITAMQSTTMQEQMAGNARERNSAFQFTEAALREGENDLTSASIGPFSSTTTSTGLYLSKTSGTDWWDLSTTWASSGSVAGALGDSNYIIEQLPPVSASGGSLEAGLPGLTLYYRVTARGTIGATGTAVVMLQSTYRR